MRTVLIAMLVSLYLPSIAAQNGIRQVDFKNFSYPLKDHLLGHSELKWLSTQSGGSAKLRTIQLKDGKELEKDSSFQMNGHEYAQYEGFTFQSVQYADVAGGSSEDAIVVLLYLSGGTQTTNYVYIYSFSEGRPKLLAYCHTGDRAYSGLYKVYGEHGLLVFELLDPEKQSGDCCSSGVVRARYRWLGVRFHVVGIPEHITLKGGRD
jgi:hypothetical protein